MPRATRSSRPRRSARSRVGQSVELAEDPRFAAVIAAFSSDRRVTSGKMMASLGLKVGGKIFAMLVRGDLVVKLPRERVTALVGAGVGQQFDPRRDGRGDFEVSVIGDASTSTRNFMVGMRPRG